MAQCEIALVVHPLHLWGGGEYYLQVLSDLLPKASIYTAWYRPVFVNQYFPEHKIVASYLQKLPMKNHFSKELIPLLPKAYKRFDFRDYQLVIVVSDGFEKNLTVQGSTKVWLHILTPPRFLWLENRASQQSNKLTYKIYKSIFEKNLHQRWRHLDKEATGRADFLTSISNTVAERVKRYYGLTSEILYPPVEMDNYTQDTLPKSREEWFLYFGRIEAYKGIELAIKACIKLKKKLCIAGTGADTERLKLIVMEMNGSRYIEFLGFVSDEEKWNLFQRCQALIYPVKDEDFGIVPVEANSAGTPVIAYAGGGANETIINKKTGLLFKRYTVEALTEQIGILPKVNIDPEACRLQACKYSREIFEEKISAIIEKLI